jgi:hypothetical protein
MQLYQPNLSTFPFMHLPAELCIEIYRYSLLRKDHIISRGHLPQIASLRYRYNEQNGLLREKCHASLAVGCQDYDCRNPSFQPEHTVESIPVHDFGFGLFLTSKQISCEAVKIFFGETHFVFESRFDLHRFLKANKHAKHMKSLTFNGRKSCGPHSKQVKARFRTWKLRSERFWGPTGSASMRELAKVCPELSYLELLDDRRCDPVQDHIDLRTRGYANWEEVQLVCSMRLQGFKYLLPDGERYRALVARRLVLERTYFDWPLQHQNVLREATEDHICDNIRRENGRRSASR